jgi:hypothetical protein
VTESVRHNGRPVMVEKSKAEDRSFGRPVGIDASRKRGNRLPQVASDLALYRLGTDSFVVTPAPVSSRLGLPLPIATRSVAFLESRGLTPAVNPRGQWVPTMSIVRIRRATLEGWSR